MNIENLLHFDRNKRLENLREKVGGKNWICNTEKREVVFSNLIQNNLATYQDIRYLIDNSLSYLSLYIKLDSKITRESLILSVMTDHTHTNHIHQIATSYFTTHKLNQYLIHRNAFKILGW